jgi:hypothetical protein
MMRDDRLALFLMLGQAADRAIHSHPQTVAPGATLALSPEQDLAVTLPEDVRDATKAAEAYRLFFVFENYLREFVLNVLSEKDADNWWGKVPKDVQDEVEGLERNEQAKAWMALGGRDKISLTTFPQLLRIIDSRWKEEFESELRDKSLVQEARHIGHLRNAVCHMTIVPETEIQRIRQVMRDWFRVVAP